MRATKVTTASMTMAIWSTWNPSTMRKLSKETQSQALPPPWKPGSFTLSRRSASTGKKSTNEAAMAAMLSQSPRRGR